MLCLLGSRGSRNGCVTGSRPCSDCALCEYQHKLVLFGAAQADAGLMCFCRTSALQTGVPGERMKQYGKRQYGMKYKGFHQWNYLLEQTHCKLVGTHWGHSHNALSLGTVRGREMFRAVCWLHQTLQFQNLFYLTQCLLPQPRAFPL